MSSTKGQYTWWFITAAVASRLLIAGILAMPHLPEEGKCVVCGMVTILAMVLVVDLPVCFLILIGRPPVMTLSPLIPSAEERARWREMRARPWLDDEEFWTLFYADSEIPKEIPLRLRKLYAEQLRMDKVWPSDNAGEFLPDIDLADLIYEIEDEFGIKFCKEAMQQLDWSFDSLVRQVARQYSDAGKT